MKTTIVLTFSFPPVSGTYSLVRGYRPRNYSLRAYVEHLCTCSHGCLVGEHMGHSLRRMNQIKNIEMGRTCGTYGGRRGAYRVLVTRPEGKRQLSRPRCRLEDNIKMDLQEMGWGTGTGLIWLRIGTDGWALVNAVTNHRFP